MGLLTNSAVFAIIYIMPNTAELINEYLDTLKRAPQTLKTYRSALNIFIDLIGDSDGLTKENYKKFLAYSQNLTPSTQHTRKSALLGLYKYYESVDLPKLDNINKHYLGNLETKSIFYDEQSLEKFLEYCNGLTGDLIALRDKAFIITLGDTGLRISEACKLKRGDIDMQNQRAIVTGKRNKTAIVRFSKHSLIAIRAYHETRAQLDGESGKPLSSLPVFASHSNQNQMGSITPDGMRKSFNQRVEAAGIESKLITPHKLRHYFVTVVLRASKNMKLAQELARHTNIQVTQRYAHISNDELDKGYEDIFNQ